MSPFKETFLRLAAPISPMLPAKALIKISGNKLILPFYHAVTDRSPAHLRYLYPVKNTRQFLADLEFLLKYFKPVDLKDVIEINNQKKKIRQPSFHLTFDDGLSEFYNVIAPILLQKGIPATCFLNSNFISNRDLFFRYKTSILIDHMHHQPAGSQAWKYFHEWCSKYNLPKLYYQKILLAIGYDKKGLLDELAFMTGVSFNDYLQKHKPYLDEGQINKLISLGFTFGAHSIDHPEYRYLSEEEQIRQTKESINFVSNSFNIGYKTFSFPFTDHEVKKSFFNTIFEEKIADITFGSAGIKNDCIVQNIQRFAAERKKTSMQEIVKNELLYNIFLKITGSVKIIRI